MVIVHHHDINLGKQIAHDLGGQSEYYQSFSVVNSGDLVLNLDKLRQQYQVDINIFPKQFKFAQTALLISDMDSTIINIECIDEMAKIYGVGKQVASITQKAMQGELDFSASLIQRLALLKGLPVGQLDNIYQNTLKLNPGAKQLITFLAKQTITTALVSGGFNFFAQRVVSQLGMDYYLANQLAIKDEQLTGKVQGDIIDGQKKAAFLTKLTKQLNCTLEQTIAMGDGSNDLPMMAQAGLSVAYHAKPIVKTQADVVIDYGGLDILIDFFNYDTKRNR